MKILNWKIFGVVVLLCLSVQTVLAIDLPKPIGFVNDYAGILQASDKQALEKILRNFEKRTSNEIAVVIISTFQGLDKSSYSQELFNAWKIGKKYKNNGVLFLLGPKEGKPFPRSGEAFVKMGKGFDGVITDSEIGFILENKVIPFLKQGKYAGGIRKGVAALMKTTKGKYKTERSKPITSGVDAGVIMEK